MYTPQVEAISPTLPADNMQEDANFRSTKDELLQQISKVDSEIAKTESTIQKLKKKNVSIEQLHKLSTDFLHYVKNIRILPSFTITLIFQCPNISS